VLAALRSYLYSHRAHVPDCRHLSLAVKAAIRQILFATEGRNRETEIELTFCPPPSSRTADTAEVCVNVFQHGFVNYPMTQQVAVDHRLVAENCRTVSPSADPGVLNRYTCRSSPRSTMRVELFYRQIQPIAVDLHLEIVSDDPATHCRCLISQTSLL